MQYNSGGANELFLARRRTARFIISSRAKRACITRAPQGQLASNADVLRGSSRVPAPLTSDETER